MITVSSDSTYSSYSPVSGESFTLSGAVTFTIDTTALPINGITARSTFQKVLLQNLSTTQPIIVPLTSTLDSSNATLELDGRKILLGTGDGVTANITVNVPVDSEGNRPSKIGSLIVGVDERWTQLPDLVNIRADHRGQHFTYDNASGDVVFGDGVNGKIPNGGIKCNNIFMEFGGSSLTVIAGEITGTGNCTIIEPSVPSSFSCRMDYLANWCIVDSPSSTIMNEFSKHIVGLWDWIGVNTSVNTKLTIGDIDSQDYILFQTNNNSSAEVFKNSRVAFNGIAECRAITPYNSTFSRVRFYLEKGEGTVKSFCSGCPSISFAGGVSGVLHLEWSDSYKIGDNVPSAVIYNSFAGNYDVRTITYIGSVDWSNRASYLFDIQAGTWQIGSKDSQFIIPIGTSFTRIFRLGGSSSGVVDRMLFNGESNSTDKDFDIFSPLGWQFNNIESPNDTNVGNSAEDNTEFNFCHMQGRTLRSGRGMNSSVVYTVADKTECSVHFKPHPDSNDSGFISGDENSIKYSSDRIYADIGTSVQTKSNTLTAFGRPTAISISGFLTNYFEVEYKLWLKGTTEPPTYKPYTLVNIQNDYDAQGLSLTTDSYFRVKVEKISNPIETGYLTDISFIAPCDNTYLWQAELEPVPINLPNIIDDTRVVVINYSKSTIVDDIITVPELIDNSIVSGGSGYSFDIELDATNEVGDTILIKANWQSGKLAKLPLRIFTVLTENGIIAIDSQEDDEIHNNMIFDGVVGLDGSLVDSSNGGELTANLTDVEVNINDSNDIFDCRRGIAWWRWVNTTEQGALIYDALGLVYKPDEYNIELQGRLKIKNAKIGSELTIINGIWSHYLGDSIIADDSATIIWVPNDRLYNANNSQITDIKALVDQYLDAAISSRATQTSVDAIDVSSLATTADITALNDFNPSTDVVANVALVDTVTTNTDMRGTDNALLGSAYVEPDNTSVSLILEDTNELQGNQGNWLTADVTGLVSIQSDIDEILANHNNPTYYFGADGTTRVEQPEAYYISLRSADGLTEIRRINAVDSSNNPTNLLQATGYN